MKIKEIFQKDYPNGKQLIYEYCTDRFYSVSLKQGNHKFTFEFEEKKLENKLHKRLESNFFSHHDAHYFQLIKNDFEVGVLVLTFHKWNNTLRIEELHIHEQYKRQGYGQELITFSKDMAHKYKARSIMLETQTLNYPAISFYMKNGFEIIGFNLNSYTNEDIENGEVRLEMGYKCLDQI
ncbi:hypothetical protein DCE79_17465 [Lysinibacillus sp. 2017]|uniref:GNAT family N-acetyltransferase n=1 Tax=unclassified Lysinibacillus TaxID=2636778 RepID=UPI000D5260E2|nr:MULTISPECIES: N-acetyltransferase [unclassified Lysinibacillus]AWE09017.1 hypothetical protein DCE79_17465 [Lysinibacillus sp. 2017]TGN35474.1 GNAT family N-acetyltransferase [Lysinibacillus sp. S2017]